MVKLFRDTAHTTFSAWHTQLILSPPPHTHSSGDIAKKKEKPFPGNSIIDTDESNYGEVVVLRLRSQCPLGDGVF